MSKKRPGVAAAVRLCQQSANDALWERVEAQWDEALLSTKGSLLGAHHQKAERLGEQLRSASKASLSKAELLDVVIPWKFAVGKPRPALWKHLRSNTEVNVATCTEEGISLARDIPTGKNIKEDDIKPAVQALTQLQGVGPATASVILSLVRPDVFAYMFDEVIDCFLSKRTYTLAVYMDCNKACHDLAQKLKWTPNRVARTLWIAARVCAAENVEDLTLSENKHGLSDVNRADPEEENARDDSRQSKRRKRR